MDAKSLAKSKRAHSQQHNKKHPHPNQKPKASPSGVAVPPKKNSKKSPALPSNWDRYSDEDDSGSEQSHRSVANQNLGVVLPKSKGADYRHLIAEANSQSNIYVDDVVSDEFSQAVSSMLSVKGEGILQWVGDDNFIFDEKTASNPEASFLTFNLHVLAEQLEKLDLSERLFIEPDLLPPELRPGPTREVQEESSRSDTCSVNIEIEDRAVNITPDKFEAELDTLLGELDFNITPDKFEAELDTLLEELDISKTRFQLPRKNPDDLVPPHCDNIDEDLDDLLKETATLTSHNALYADVDDRSPNPKLLNDFDSWLDTL